VALPAWLLEVLVERLLVVQVLLLRRDSGDRSWLTRLVLLLLRVVLARLRRRV
jgi:hypothetical protein